MLDMPDRMIRDEILDSQAWLTLKDNGDRLAFISLLLKADSLGDFPASPFRLMRLWRDFGIGTPELVAKTLSELSDHGLIRLYSVDENRYLHIPKFRQSLRYISNTFPVSPWITEAQKQALTKKSQCDHNALTGRSHQKRSEVLRNSKKAVRGNPPVDNFPSQSWAEHWTAQGKAFGINAKPGETTGDYCKRVISLIKAKAV
jgi:hypothetical protein